MNCEHASEVHAYHDGGLTAAQAEAFERHLTACDACRADLADLRRLSELIASAPLVEPSTMAMHRLAGGVRRSQERSIRRLAGWLTAAAAAVVVVATLIRPAPTPVGSVAGVSGADVDLLGLDSSGEPLPETLVAAQWIALDLGAMARGGAEQ